MPTPLTDAIQALTRYANETTGQSDTTLSDAVNTLVEGYGQGGGGTNVLTHNWDFTQSLTDTVGEMTATLTNCTQSSSGVYFDQLTSRITFPAKLLKANSRIELDIASYDRQGTAHGRLIMVSNDQGFVYRSTGYWGAYRNGGGTQIGWQMTTISDPAYFDGHTLKMVIDENGIATFYRDNDSIMTVNGLLYDGSLTIGYNGNSAYNLTITGLRIYENWQGRGNNKADFSTFSVGNIKALIFNSAHIDTDLYINSNKMYTVKFKSGAKIQYEHVYGISYGNGNIKNGVQRSSSSDAFNEAQYGATVAQKTAVVDGDDIVFSLCAFDKTPVYEAVHPLLIGDGYYNSNRENKVTNITFYGLNIVDENDEYVAQLMPWLEDDVPCVKDIVSGSLYYATAGTLGYIDKNNVIHN